jgi:predicted Zn-dependent protease
MRLFAPLFALALASCGGHEGEGGAIGEAERRQGAEVHPQLLTEFGGAYEAEEARYLEALGGKVAAAAGLEGQCTFTLVNSDVVNAFAVPGCFIYVTRGMMGIVTSEGELAAVLAHEVGHIVGRHGARQQRRSLWRQIGVVAVGVLTGSEQLTRLAGEAAALFTLRYSRKQEYEADDLGLRYLREAGYDPFAASDMLGALGRHEQFMARTRGRDPAKGIPEWARTHPLTGNRIERAREAASATGVGPDELPEHEARYLGEVDGLLWGDDPQQGFVLGRRFTHPVMRIGFEAPEGFTLTNSPQAILIEGPEGIRGQLAGGKLPAGGLEAYAEAVLAGLLRDAPARIGEPERLSVNGVPALFLPATVATEQGEVLLRLAAYAGSGGEAWHFLLVSAPSSAADAPGEALFRSFRLLSAEEAASLRPRRIRVVAAAPGETLRSLAARTAADHPLDLVMMLNGIAEERPVRPGERLKIVTLAER